MKSSCFLPVIAFLLAMPAARADITARYVRVDDPTSHLMCWQEIEVSSGGRNLVAGHGDWFSGTWLTSPGRKPIVGPRLTDGRKDPTERGPNIETGDTHVLGAWFEIDLQVEAPVEGVTLYGSRSAPGFREFLDRGHRVLTLLDAQRRVLWSTKWNVYDIKRYPKGIYRFTPMPADAQSPMHGAVVKAGQPMAVAMSWVLDVQPERTPSDAGARSQRFAARNSPAAVRALAEEFFRLLEPEIPGLDQAYVLHARGDDAAALEAWKRWWFARMARANLHLGFDGNTFTYRGQGDDLLTGVRATINPTTAAGSRFTPGRICWVDIPDHGAAEQQRAALEDAQACSYVGRMCPGLLESYAETGDAKYLDRWAEILDDWSMNFFADAEASRFNVKDLFAMNHADTWGKLMEDLSDVAVKRPAVLDILPAETLARMQLACLENYGPGYWRQARETMFNHNTSGLSRWAMTLPYIDEFRPATRLAREWRQHFERWMTLGTEPDGSMTEICDEGHFSIPMVLGCDLKSMQDTKPEWFTPGWRNRALEWFDNLHKYVFRHAAPGGYDHRFDHRLYSPRFYDVFQGGGIYARDGRHVEQMLDRSGSLYGTPEVRRILDKVCCVSAGLPEPDAKAPYWVKNQYDQRVDAREAALKVLGNERPGEPRITSDWMPYTGAYYFRSGWAQGNAFLAMLARNSRGGSEPDKPSWSYGLVYAHDYGFPLMRAETFTIDGQQQNTLGDKMTYIPGTKSSSLTYAERDPAPHRWHSSPRFAFGEAAFQGSYRRIGFKYEPGWLVDPQAGKLEVSDKPVDGVRANRQVMQLRDSRLFVLTDTAHFQRDDVRAQKHAYVLPLTLMLSTLEKGAARPFDLAQLSVDTPARTLATQNPDGANVTLRQFAGFPLQYTVARPAKPDFREYSAELTSNTGIAAQGVIEAWQTPGDCTLVTLVESRPQGAGTRLKSIEPASRGNSLAGFHAVLDAGGEIWYQASAGPAEQLACGGVTIRGESLLVTRSKADAARAGIALGVESMSIDGHAAPLTEADFEFSLNMSGELRHTAIYRPIENVRFSPDRNTFTDALTVEMTCATPGVEIRYTTDGAPPVRTSSLYTGPITITETTEIAARAYRLGPDGKPLAADDFEINGTRFTAPSYGWFYKRPLRPAVPVDEAALSPGLACEHLAGNWVRLYSQGHWLPVVRMTVAEREMDLRQVKSTDYYGARFKGYLRVPAEGVYTFHAPREFVLPDIAASYDLRVYVDGEEWYLTQWWHGHGTWSVPLAQGYHRFEVDFADARTTPWRKSDLWRYYPRPWVVYQGDPGPILISGPGIEKQRIPATWFRRTAKEQPQP